MSKTGWQVAATLLVVVGGCAGPAGPDLSSEASNRDVAGEVELAPGRTATIPGTSVAVTLVAVEEDSRCPVDVVCVWQGNLRAVLDLEAPGMGPDARVGLNTALEPTAVDFAGLTLAIVEARPVPRSDVTIEPDDYRVTVRATVSDGRG
ncbi:MAG: hypothetical protein PVI57_21175 [Gemmatimonadota bacterium]|jgi:hypothetical protein